MGMRGWVVVVVVSGCGGSSSNVDAGGEASSSDGADDAEPTGSTYCSRHEWRCEGLDCPLEDDERAYVVAFTDAADALDLSNVRIGPASHEPIGGGIVIAYEVEIGWLRLPAQARWALDLAGAELEATAHAELESLVGAEIADRMVLEDSIRACNAALVVDACTLTPWALGFDFARTELHAFANEATSPDNCIYQATEVTLDLATGAALECTVHEPYDVCVPETD